MVKAREAAKHPVSWRRFILDGPSVYLVAATDSEVPICPILAHLESVGDRLQDGTNAIRISVIRLALWVGMCSGTAAPSSALLQLVYEHVCRRKVCCVSCSG